MCITRYPDSDQLVKVPWQSSRDRNTARSGAKVRGSYDGNVEDEQNLSVRAGKLRAIAGRGNEWVVGKRPRDVEEVSPGQAIRSSRSEDILDTDSSVSEAPNPVTSGLPSGFLREATSI
ncbi:hypothetical protein KM043_010184 [Ampulex compressa]|nr:hypothetical protein KM043_010184 [Ampulex compressa]